MADEIEKALGFGAVQATRVVPGMQAVEWREFRYISDAGSEDFCSLFKKIVRHVNPPIPKNGGAMIENCRITLPSGEAFHAVSYRGDIEAWRRQIEIGAASLGARVARIIEESIVLADGLSERLSDCEIEFY